MRVTVIYEDIRYSLNVKPDDRVVDLKKKVRNELVEVTAEDKRIGRYLELTFGGN